MHPLIYSLSSDTEVNLHCLHGGVVEHVWLCSPHVMIYNEGVCFSGRGLLHPSELCVTFDWQDHPCSGATLFQTLYKDRLHTLQGKAAA